MKESLTLNDMASELERRLDAMDDFHVDTRRTGFAITETPTVGGVKPPNVPVLTIDLPDETWFGNINDHAQNQIGQRLNIPGRFWDRMRDNHPDILTDTVTKLFVREPEVRMIRTLDGNVRAFLSNAYKARDNYDLMAQAILPAVQEAKMEVRSCALTETRMYLKVLFPDVEAEIKEGDIVQAGICVSNSEVGSGSTSVEPFLYRLICTNGAIAPISFAEFGLRKHHVGRRIGEDGGRDESLFSERSLKLDDEAFFSIVYDVVKGSINGVAFARMVDRLRDMTNLETKGDPVAVVERIARRQRFTEDEAGSVMRHLIEGGDLSAYGYMNAVTRASQDVESYDRATEFERVGGDMLEWSDRAWKDLLSARKSDEKEKVPTKTSDREVSEIV